VLELSSKGAEKLHRVTLGVVFFEK